MPYLCSDVKIGGAVGSTTGIVLVLIFAGAAYVLYRYIFSVITGCCVCLATLYRDKYCMDMMLIGN